jgi:hypothetical protein
MSDTVTTVAVPAVDAIFAETVDALRRQIDQMQLQAKAQAQAGLAQARVDVIDVELVFKSVAVQGSSGLAKLLVSDKQTSSTMELRLSTRVRIDWNAPAGRHAWRRCSGCLEHPVDGRGQGAVQPFQLQAGIGLADFFFRPPAPGGEGAPDGMAVHLPEPLLVAVHDVFVSCAHGLWCTGRRAHRVSLRPGHLPARRMPW